MDWLKNTGRDVGMDSLACVKSWRTTGLGFVLLAIGFLRAIGYPIDHIETSPEILIVAGLGLVFARDAAR